MSQKNTMSHDPKTVGRATQYAENLPLWSFPRTRPTGICRSISQRRPKEWIQASPRDARRSGSKHLPVDSGGHWDPPPREGLASLLRAVLLADMPSPVAERQASSSGLPWSPSLDPPLAETLSFPKRAGACVPGPADKHRIVLVMPSGIHFSDEELCNSYCQAGQWASSLPAHVSALTPPSEILQYLGTLCTLLVHP